MSSQKDLVDDLGSFALFADLKEPQLLAVVETLEERHYVEGERVLRQGLTGSGFHVILSGEAAVVVDGVERDRLRRGDFFGELSILLGDLPVADVIATSALGCLVLAADQVEPFLSAYPPVMFRMLQAEARRLRRANRWRN